MDQRRLRVGRRTAARTASVSGVVIAGTWIVCVFFAVVALALGVLGIAGVVAARDLGNSISSQQLAATNLGVDLERALAGARSSTQTLMFAPAEADRVALAGRLFDGAVPVVEARLADLKNSNADASPPDRAAVAALATQWAALRTLIGTSMAPTRSAPDTAAATRIGSAFDDLDARLVQLSDRERATAVAATARASDAGRQWIWTIGAAASITALASVLCGWWGGRRIRTALEPAQDQVMFADTLQMAENEDEAHSILKRHLERGIGPGAVTVLNRNNSADRLEAVTEVPPGSVLAQSLSHAQPNACLAVRSGLRHINDGDERALLRCPVCGPCSDRSACYPLTVGGAVIGAVLVSGATALQPRHRQRARESVGQAAPVLANLRNLAVAEIRASTDALTALPNKRTVGDTLRRMLAQATRGDTPLSLLTMDLDHFKDVNDRFGHPVGDQALAGVGEVLRSALRAGDFAGRNGGEEFSVILPETEVAGALVTAEKIRSTIAAMRLPDVDLQLTVSIGLAAYPQHALTTERLERLADSALYVAKRSGRNRIEIASPATDIEPVMQGSPVGNGISGRAAG